MSEPPLLTRNELDIAFREGATDDQIEAVLRNLIFWSYIVRNPLAKSVPSGGEREQTASLTRSDSPTITLSTVSRFSRIRRMKPAPSMALGASCCGRRSSTRIHPSGRHRQMSSMIGRTRSKENDNTCSTTDRARSQRYERMSSSWS